MGALGRTRRRRPGAAYVPGGSGAPEDGRRPARRRDLAAAKLTPCARARWARGQTRGMSNPETQQHPQVLVVGPDGIAAAEPQPEEGERPVTEMVEQPAKVMRIGSMIRQLLEEVRAAPLDEKSRARLKEIHQSSIKELEDGLAPELVAELERLSLPFTEDELPSEAELRVAQAQLVGWLEGLFHGIQTTLFAQQ